MNKHQLYKFFVIDTRLKSIFFLLFFSLLLVACSDQSFYEKSYSFKRNTWSQKVKPIFKVEILDTSIFYDFILTFRNTTDYAYSNAWIYLNTKTPNKIKAREPFEIKITNPDGTWIGTKSGTVVENLLYFKRRKFPLKGIYCFQLEQAVVQENLTEVLDIGLRMLESEKH